MRDGVEYTAHSGSSIVWGMNQCHRVSPPPSLSPIPHTIFFSPLNHSPQRAVLGLTFPHKMGYNIHSRPAESRMPQVECSRRVGYKCVPYRFTSTLPIPHTLFFFRFATPLAIRSETQWLHRCRGCIDLAFPISFLYPHFYKFLLFFLLLGGKYEKVCNLCKETVF